MNIIRFIAEQAGLFLALFALGCVVSLIRAFRKSLPPEKAERLKLLEWCLLPPGFAVIFITLQQYSVRAFALHPTWTIVAFLGIAACSALLLLEKRRKRRAFLAWLGDLFGVTGVVFSLILIGLYLKSPQKFEKIRATYDNLAATQGNSAPDFAFTLLSNRTERHLADYRGKVVLLNIWATWCGPCLKEMPDLDRLQKKFERAGLVVINLSDESLEVIDRHLAKHPMATTHGRIEKRNVPEFYRFGEARPTSFLIGAKGDVIEAIAGAKDLSYFESIINPHL